MHSFKYFFKNVYIASSAIPFALFHGGAHAQQSQYPPITPPAQLNTAQKIAAAARWLGANTKDIAIKDTIVPAKLPKFADDGWSNYWQYLIQNNSAYQQYRRSKDSLNCVVGPQNDAAIERVITHEGTEVYDAAVWQIALAVAISQNNPYITRNDKYNYRATLTSYENLLINDNPANFATFRAYDPQNNFLYGLAGVTVPRPYDAYIRRFMSPSWAGNTDPVNNCQMNWPEYTAVTGEEAWAMLIGPIQASYLAKAGDPDWIWDARIDSMSIPALYPISLMQDSTVGGVYRNVVFPDKSNFNDKFNISIENNFSLYAGLRMLKDALTLRMDAFSKQRAPVLMHAGKPVSLAAAQDALAQVNQIIAGLDMFFTNGSGKAKVWNDAKGFFYAEFNKNGASYLPGLSPDNPDNFAVDVQSWGASVIINYPDLAAKLTQAYGPDLFSKMWHSMKTIGGYSENGVLLGVGYGPQDPAKPYYQLSGEWTLGAINAAFAIASYLPNDPIAAEAVSDARLMMQGMHSRIATLYSDGRVGYLYANKRALIPFGWFSNAMPSTASTGWGLLVNSCYDPFVIGGAPERASVCQSVLGEPSPRIGS